ncbi:MAG TPA: poly-gamma-glutamate system protein [Candidatus Cloacimonas sp.]|nr:poly-gamma-glutamate system protein [Candidatus Cloacimonas sp.]HPS61190.1 poly-gamma-glutamate system protein [Candidatus Cloacimonas sp.]
MMYRPSLKSNRSLIILLLLAILLFYIAQTSYIKVRTDNYDAKLASAQLMKAAIDSLTAELHNRNIEIDPIDDPLQTGLIGIRLSSITTDRGLLSEKRAALNPNLAAIFVEELSKLKLMPGDYIAVGITGSNPAVNIALYSALQVMELNPKIIVALSSASYGANRPELTWLDIESILKEKGLFKFNSSYASLGGKEDLAIGLSDNGILALREAMSRNNVPLLIGSDLNDNIDIRMAAYEELLPAGERYKAFVNIGTGLANVGSEPNANLIPEGINRSLAEHNYEKEGVMIKMAKNNVPVLHFRRILRWAKRYNLPTSFDTMPKVGEGKMFSSLIHNQTINIICLAILLIAIVVVIIFDRHDRRFMANIIDPDEEL